MKPKIELVLIDANNLGQENMPKIELIQGDCLIESDKIESGSVDLILTDLPFGTMKGLDAEPIKGDNNKNYVAGGGYKKGYDWDAIIEPKKVYEIASRVLRKNGKMVLFCQEPYTTQLINEAIPNIPFSYRAIWEKNDFANCLFAKKAMVNYYEDVLVFSKNHPKHDFEGVHPLRPYFKIVMDFIGLNIKQINTKLGHRKAEHTFYIDSTQFLLCTKKTYNELIDVFGIDKIEGFKNYVELKQIDTEYRTELLRQMNEQYPSTFNLWEGNKYKSNILKYKKDYNGYHPTQKPVLLLEDLIKTFSNEGNLVVDLTMGSGSTGVACVNTNRNFIGVELDLEYFKIAEKRINEVVQPQSRKKTLNGRKKRKIKMKPKIELMLIDANNLGHRNYHTLEKEKDTEEIEKDFLFSFLNSVQILANNFETNNIVFAWDSKKSYRKKKYPGYKNRKKQELAIDLYKQFDILKTEILSEMGFKNIFYQIGIEADDIIAQICNQEPKKNKVIISNDGDMRQCLDYYTWQHTGKKLVTKDEFAKEILKLDPKHYYPKIKAMAGCVSDNVIGIAGVGELTAARYFADKSKLTKKKIELIESEMWVMHKNLPFVKLPYEKTKSFEIGYNDFSEDRMIGIFEKYEFEYFLRNMDKWDIFYER